MSKPQLTLIRSDIDSQVTLHEVAERLRLSAEKLREVAVDASKASRAGSKAGSDPDLKLVPEHLF